MAIIGSSRGPIIRAKSVAELFAFTTFTFSTGGAVGQLGPYTQNFSSDNSYTSQPWYSNYFSVGTVTQGVQSWTVPSTGSYRITAGGASGGANNGGTFYPGLPGTGATIRGDFLLTVGTVLSLVVGQAGVYGANGSGGGGGSFVYTGSIGGDGLLVAAGGGGGWGHGSASFIQVTGGIGSSNTSSTGGASSAGTGASGGIGQGGLGGASSIYGSGGGGTGWLSQGSNGLASSSFGYGGQRWAGGTANGTGATATNTGQGGYGGGGGWGGNNGAAGGAGGYSGGGGGNGYNSTSWGAGGGGGSYNAGSNQVNTQGSTTTVSINGYITITKL